MTYKESYIIKVAKKIFMISSYINGWKIQGSFPNIPKFIAIIAPHTSALDFWHMIGTRVLLDLDYYTKDKQIIKRNIFWLAKKSLFKWPIKSFIRKLGALPVNRSKSNNFVQTVAKIISESNTFIIGIAPDGTRLKSLSMNFKWKTGFYHLAKKTNTPVIACFINSDKKKIIISIPFHVTGNFDNDMKKITTFYRNNI